MFRRSLFALSIVLILAFAGSANAFSGTVDLSGLELVNSMGHPIQGSINVGDQVGFSSLITNKGSSAQKFTYLVQVLDSNGGSEYFEGFSASFNPGQSYNASQMWMPQKPGVYTVQVFVWQSLTDPIPLSDMVQKTFTVG